MGYQKLYNHLSAWNSFYSLFVLFIAGSVGTDKQFFFLSRITRIFKKFCSKFILANRQRIDDNWYLRQNLSWVNVQIIYCKMWDRSCPRALRNYCNMSFLENNYFHYLTGIWWIHFHGKPRRHFLLSFNLCLDFTTKAQSYWIPLQVEWRGCNLCSHSLLQLVILLRSVNVTAHTIRSSWRGVFMTSDQRARCRNLVYKTTKMPWTYKVLYE